jgi:hypothetical protein
MDANHTSMATEKTIKLKVENGEAILKVDELNKALKDTNKQTDNLNNTLDAGGEALDKFTKGGFSAMKSLYSGAKTAIGAMTTLKGAIISTGIGALVVAVGTLAAYFTQTSRGADQFAKIMGGIEATIKVVIDRAVQLGEALTLVFSGEFSKAADMAKNAFKGIGDEIAREAKQGAALAEALDNVEDRERDLIVLRAKSNKEIAKARMIADDTTKSTNERIAAVQKAFKLEQSVANAEQKNARAYLKYLDDRIKMGESTDEDLKARSEAQAKVLELETESLRRQKRLQGEVTSLKNEDKVALEAGIKLREEAAKKELEYQAFIKNGERETIELINKTNAARVVALTEFNNQVSKLRGVGQTDRERELAQIKTDSENAMRALIESGQATADKAVMITTAQREAELKVNRKYDQLEQARQRAAAAQKLELLAQSFGALAQLSEALSKGDEKNAEKSFKITKALRLGEAVANTAAGIMGQLAVPQDQLTGANFVKAGIIAVTGAAQIATIAKSKFNPGTSTAEKPTVGSAPSGGGGGFTPNISFTGIGQNPFGGMFGQPMQAYVVGQQMNNANMLERRIRNSATFGG